MTLSSLRVLLAGREVAWLTRDRRGRLDLVYDETWREELQAFPISLSLPLAAGVQAAAAVEAFLWGLLPDNTAVLERWARRFSVSPRNVFALIAEVGEDCAGAVQFVRPERLVEVTAPSAPEVAWLTEDEVAARLSMLRADIAAWRLAQDAGQFSLAGAQPKTALLLQGDRWGVPAGRLATTHILKPPVRDLDGHAENEHFCLVLARALDLPAATSEVRRFGQEVAIVVERYDRVQQGAPPVVLRVHQEDLCQALGLMPIFKYQNEGGPPPRDILQILRDRSSRPQDDSATFVGALAFNWLIARTDAHAKNYSLLHGGGGRVRLAPLYDLASALPYDDLDPQRLKLAMKIGGEYRLRDIGLRQWRKLAAELRLDEAALIAQVASLAERLPDAVSETRRDALVAGLTPPIVERLAERLTARAQHCQALLRL